MLSFSLLSGGRSLIAHYSALITVLGDFADGNDSFVVIRRSLDGQGLSVQVLLRHAANGFMSRYQASTLGRWLAAARRGDWFGGQLSRKLEPMKSSGRGRQAPR